MPQGQALVYEESCLSQVIVKNHITLTWVRRGGGGGGRGRRKNETRINTQTFLIRISLQINYDYNDPFCFQL
jgi:hypothetical protein